MVENKIRRGGFYIRPCSCATGSAARTFLSGAQRRDSPHLLFIIYSLLFAQAALTGFASQLPSFCGCPGAPAEACPPCRWGIPQGRSWAGRA